MRSFSFSPTLGTLSYLSFAGPSAATINGSRSGDTVAAIFPVSKVGHMTQSQRT